MKKIITGLVALLLGVGSLSAHVITVSSTNLNISNCYTSLQAATNAAKPGDTSPAAEKSRRQPLYALGEKIVTTSTSGNKRTLQCRGSMSVTVGDTKASKEVNFTVQQSSNGKVAVSVAPFRF